MKQRNFWRRYQKILFVYTGRANISGKPIKWAETSINFYRSYEKSCQIIKPISSYICLTSIFVPPTKIFT